MTNSFITFFDTRSQLREFAKNNKGQSKDFGKSAEPGKRWGFLHEESVSGIKKGELKLLSANTSKNKTMFETAETKFEANHLVEQEDAYNTNKFGDKLLDKPVKVYKKKSRKFDRVVVENTSTGEILLDTPM